MTPNLPLPDEATATPALAAEYAAARRRTGSVMAILRAMGPRPEVLQAFLALSEAALYGPATLGRREREVLALATSQANDAEYSASAHTALLEDLGGADGSARDRALVDFARRLTLAPHEAGEAVSELRTRVSDAEVYDAIAVVGLLKFANRAALATGISAADDLS
jgi:AhpD family alkylhydroperoxidase